MVVRYWSPLSEMESLRRRFDRAFEDLLETPHDEATSWVPSAELNDTGEAFVLRLSLPGIDIDKLDIQVTRDAIAVTGDRPAPERDSERFYRTEFHYGAFQRAIQLPGEVKNDSVSADYENGILTLTLPKTDADRHRAIKVDLSSFKGQNNKPALKAEVNANG